MITKNQIKLIISLQQKKFRITNKLFIAEGEKVIRELLNSKFELEHIYCVDATFDDINLNNRTIISKTDLQKISALSTANNCLAVFRTIENQIIDNLGLTLVLDNIRDPGNFGTIIRICDWYGIKQIICSNETVDFFNPKVVQATMGSLTRVNIIYADLNDYLAKTKIPIFGTFMDGENIYKSILPEKALIIMGNEANGISENIEKLIKNRLSIPRFGTIQKTESLNVATATAIVLSEFMRNK
jgi:RNA methyltransferase, TrmH family